MVFYCINDLKKQNWIRLRLYFVYIPYGLMNILFLYDFYKFFETLEEYNDQFSQSASVPVENQVLTEAYVTIWLTHFIISPFFQGLSYAVYALEMGSYLDKKH